MRSIALAIIAVVISLLSFWIPNDAIAGEAYQQVCDVSADYYLGTEDYSEAIRRHVDFVRRHPDNALAHYHLGFALGMADDRMSEIREYQQAEALGLRSWDLFLNLGLAQLENGDLDAATDSLRHAVVLGEDHSESHFNLALVEERRGMLAEAQREILASLLLNPGQPDARNLLGVIYAQEADGDHASLIWRELVREVPDYEPARENLAILGSQSAAANGETTAVVLPPTAVVKAIGDEQELRLRSRLVQMNPSSVQYNGR